MSKDIKQQLWKEVGAWSGVHSETPDKIPEEYLEEAFLVGADNEPKTHWMWAGLSGPKKQRLLKQLGQKAEEVKIRQLIRYLSPDLEIEELAVLGVEALRGLLAHPDKDIRIKAQGALSYLFEKQGGTLKRQDSKSAGIVKGAGQRPRTRIS